MSFISAFDSAVSGIRQSWSSLEQAASRLSVPNEDINLVPELVDMEALKQSVKANAKVAKTTDEMLGTLVDMLA